MSALQGALEQRYVTGQVVKLGIGHGLRRARCVVKGGLQVSEVPAEGFNDILLGCASVCGLQKCIGKGFGVAAGGLEDVRERLFADTELAEVALHGREVDSNIGQ